ncbi:hypothetical protein GCM10020000_62420 [Streptomyces olivoverticillatus]
MHIGNPRDALGLDHTDVEVPGELGALPAWFVPAARDTWVITVHGLGTTREHPMNVLPFLHGLRLPVLAPAYRNDPGAPGTPHGISHLGAHEWRDLDAAVDYAVRRGARRVVLHGWSTGATMALLAAVNGAHGDRIAGVVLDSPVLDWPAALRALAGHRAPAALIPLAVRAAEGRTGLTPRRPAGRRRPRPAVRTGADRARHRGPPRTPGTLPRTRRAQAGPVHPAHGPRRRARRFLERGPATLRRSAPTVPHTADVARPSGPNRARPGAS